MIDLPQPTIEIVHLDPVRAQVRFHFDPAQLPPDTEMRGRLVGPRCPGASTVEVAYPIRPTATPGVFEVTIPEPSLWSPESPFTYQAIFEAYREGKPVAQRVLSCGLRM